MPAGRTRYAYIVSFFSSRVGRFCRAVEFGVVWKGDLWGRYLQQMVGMLDVGNLVEGRDVYGRLGSGCGGVRPVPWKSGALLEVQFVTRTPGQLNVRPNALDPGLNVGWSRRPRYTQKSRNLIYPVH